jgi:hypothetical protein
MPPEVDTSELVGRHSEQSLVDFEITIAATLSALIFLDLGRGLPLSQHMNLAGVFLLLVTLFRRMAGMNKYADEGLLSGSGATLVSLSELSVIHIVSTLFTNIEMLTSEVKVVLMLVTLTILSLI